MRSDISPTAPEEGADESWPTDSRRHRRVVIVTHNSATDIETCLSALEGERIIVVDNASRDGTIDLVASHGARPTIVTNAANRGFAAAANQGIRAADDCDVVLVNPDVVVTPSTLDRLAATARQPGVGLVAPRLVYPDGTVQESLRTFPTLHRLLARCTPIGRTPVGQRWRTEYLRPAATLDERHADWVIGAVMYLRRPALDIVRGFDEYFFLYGEDVDLCARLRLAGMSVLYDGGATAMHKYRRDSRQVFDLRRPPVRHHWASMARLARRYPLQFFAGRPLTSRAQQKRRAIGLAERRRRALGPASDHHAHLPGAKRPHLRGEVPIARLAVERFFQMTRLYHNWPIAVADRLGLLPDGRHVIYRVRSGNATAELIARSNGCDVRTIGEVWIGGLYDRLMDRGTMAGRQMVIVDIGANCGYFAVYMAHRHPGARIVCFEPETENRSLAHANVLLNSLDVEIRPEATVADRSSSVSLNLSHDTRLHTTVPPDLASRQGIDAGRYSGRMVEVPAININDAIYETADDSRIDLMKVDVEGVDLELVLAIEDAALAQIDFIVAETENRDTRAVSRRLAGAGFSVVEDAGLLFAGRHAAATPSEEA